MTTLEIIKLISIVFLIALIGMQYFTNRRLGDQLRRTRKERDLAERQWDREAERAAMFKAKVIEQGMEIDRLRDPEPVIKYVEDASRVGR